MYINPVLVGVLGTLLVEGVLFIAYVVIYSFRQKKKK